MVEMIRKILVEVKENDNLQEITENTDIVEDIGLDSLETIQFILGLEDECETEIDFDEFEFELLHKVGDLIKYLEMK